MAEPAAAQGQATYRAAMREMVLGAGAAAFVGFFVNLLHLALPLYNAQVYDRVIGSGNLDTLVALTVLVVILLVFGAVLDVLRSRIFAILAARLAGRLGRPVFEAAVETSLRGGSAAAGDVMRDLSDLKGFVAGGAIALPIDLTFSPVLIGVLFLLNPIYGLIGCVGALILAATGVATEVLARRPAARATAATGRTQAETATAIRSAEVIAAMGMLPDIARRWHRTQAQALDSADRGQATARTLSAVARLLRTGIQIAVICAGTTLVVEQEATVGTIIAAMAIMSRLLLPFEHLIDGWRQWVDASAAHGRIQSLLRDGGSPRSVVPAPVGSSTLVADRLTYVPAGQDTPLLRNVSFRIEAGELVGVVGPSGAGKSTLARLVVGLWAPSAGGVYLDGQSTFLHERSSFGAAVGYLPQEPLLLDGTVRENIARFRDAPMDAVIAAARQAGVHDLIGRMPKGYGTRLADGGGRLSGGQRQRIALARAVFGDPQLLVLDEPNSSLDAEGEAALVSAVETARQRGAAVLVIAQRMSILAKADRLIVLRDGAVAHYGPRAEVLAAIGPQRQAQRPGPVYALGGEVRP
ncbi:type I secretion system permease/ATPase [Cereibacter sphaeroides]|uniref:type I secretion system permease/ATPase n=1 Tax=Cereibacter sphaeroides TaxID=1063 RepID=UPI001F1C8C2C|nr:type I secretion system permease/ATPase [Cereibacter sphaeroides]MCE6951100.1 type I secretion system permease/ATPase [Cereibacter sphaeroides]